MSGVPETDQQRRKRRRQRLLFDGVARLYQTTRLSYPDDVLRQLVSTTGLTASSTVLEVGCGTGQLTESLAQIGCDLTAIDIGPSMIAAARQRLRDAAVTFRVSAFEDFAVPDASVDLIVSATAFHWTDPEVRFVKSARLLRPGGWLAWLVTGEQYHDPLRAALIEMWRARSEDGRALTRDPGPTPAQLIEASGLFETPVESRDERPMLRSADLVIGVENTRATSLSWPADDRATFTEELRRHLEGQAEVPITQETSLTMARVPT